MISILFFVFFLFSFIAFFSPKDALNKYILYTLIGFVLIVIAAFRSEEGNPDYANYKEIYEDARTGDVLVEFSYVFISHIVQFIFDNILFLFLIYAIIGVYLKLTAIKQLTDLWFLSLLIYVSNFFILHEVIQIRVGVASGFLLLCIKPIYDRNLKRFLVLVLLAVFFHVSSLIILPLWFLGKFKNKINFFIAGIIVPIGYCVYLMNVTILNFIPIPYVQEKLDVYAQLQELGTADFLTEINVFNYVFLARIIFFYFLLYKSELLMSHNKYTILLLNIYAISLFMYPALAMMPVLAGRISELLGVVEIILLPLIYYTIRPRYISISIIVVWSFGILMVNIFKSQILG
jgi:hypothetical protein